MTMSGDLLAVMTICLVKKQNKSVYKALFCLPVFTLASRYLICRTCGYKTSQSLHALRGWTVEHICCDAT